MGKTNSDILQELNEAFILDSDQINFYEMNGFIKLKHVFSPELVEYYSTFVQEAVSKADTAPIDEQAEKDNSDPTYSKAFHQVINIWTTSPECKQIAFSKRLASIATQLMKVSGVRIYHDQALFKPPAAGHTPFHCDQFYWPLNSDKTITAWIPLVQITDNNLGPLEFVAGSHKEDLGRAVGIGQESDRVISSAVQKGNYRIESSGYDLGDVSFHAGWTFHRAEPNSNKNGIVRKVYTVIYMDQDIRSIMPVNDNQRADYRRYLSGVEIGGVCDGPLNPLVYSTATATEG